MNTFIQKASCQGPVTLSLAAVIGTVAILAGCATEPASRVVSAPPPNDPGTTTSQTVVVPATQAAPAPTTTNAPATVIVQQAPPSVQQESVPARPSPRHVWVGGYWIWENNNYQWVPGTWTVPPRERAVWVPPRWEREGNGFRFYDGYWDND